MSNPKTTVGGYLLILAAIISAFGKVMVGHMPEMTDFTLFVMGLGLVVAKDGGH